MWYHKKFVPLPKLFSFLIVLSSFSAAIGAEKNNDIQASNLPNTILQQVEETLQFGNKEFLEEEKQLIEGRPLNLWGIALFSANDWVGTFIRTATDSDWSHCGLILKDEKDQSLYGFESTGAASDIVKGVWPQVQIHLWQEVVDGYNGKVAQRQFIFNDKSPSSEAVIKYVNDNLGKSYEKSAQALIDAIDRNNKKENLTSLFCSEMVAACLIQLGYLNSSDRLAANYLPRDFSSKEFLPWINDAALGKEAIIKKTPTKCGCCTIM
ncbi:hypothetical protein [Candidatus Paracaedibacter symbiosus]|uniref:hypothetical protein n=1 Tax=Candidatus Paracaedibacter symbiosus TaxID=244582 RepID=UPI000509AE68|nr:hypothetical protein [Candidatus Paracaedibacter symbiosus]